MKYDKTRITLRRQKTIKGGSLFELTQKLNASSQLVYDNVKNITITSITVYRAPISSAIDSLFNMMSLGTWNKIKQENNVDRYFHLSSVLGLESGERIMFEKNQTIHIEGYNGTPSNESLRVQVPPNTTLELIMDGMARIMGNQRLFKYDAFTSNCQDFIMAMLTSIGQNTPENTAWVKQPMEMLISKMPKYTHYVANTVTNLGNKVDELYQQSSLQKTIDKGIENTQKLNRTLNNGAKRLAHKARYWFRKMTGRGIQHKKYCN